MISETAVSRRELLKRLSMAGAAALALPGIRPCSCISARGPQGHPGRCVERYRRRDPRRNLLAHHPDRRKGPGAAEARAASTSIARSADGLRHRATRTRPVSPQSTTPRAQGRSAICRA